MIAYHILCHDNFRQVAALVRALHTPETTILVDVDDGKRPDTRPLETLRTCRTCTSSATRTSAGAVAARCARPCRARSICSNWTRAGGTTSCCRGRTCRCRSNEAILERFSRADADRTNFIRCHLAEPIRIDEAPVKNRTARVRRWEDRGHTRLWACPGVISPHVKMYARRLVDVTEVGVRGEVYVGNCEPLLARRRDDFFARHPFHTGPNWFDLHRSLIEHLRDDPFAYELYEVMRSTFIPDESYFQTYLMNGAFRETVDHDYGRFIHRPVENPEPKVFDEGDWPLIEASGAFYARKFDTRRDRRIVRRVLESRAA